ncbi:MAG TPA: DUF5956 family protein [Candidatus Lumbricidophila sp.]|nr:DUF5956 family protein [Candidatus Lumbricidophila sp.]
MTKVVVPDVGWQLLIAIVVSKTVSVELVSWISRPPELQRVRGERTRSDGTPLPYQRFLSPSELAEFAYMNDKYLTDAGVEPVAAGTVLQLTLPDGVADMDEFCALLSRELDDRAFQHPLFMASALRQIIPRHYGRTN